MKKGFSGRFFFFGVVLLIVAVAVGQLLIGSGYSLYPRAGRAVIVSRLDGRRASAVVDSFGHYWWIDQAVDFNEGDMVALMICDAGTRDTILDDYVVKAVSGCGEV